MQAYLSSLCSSCIRILTKALPFVYETSRVADVISALRETSLGQLLPYAVNVLYVGNYAMDVISYVSGDLLELLTMWCRLMKVCCIDVGLIGTIYSRTIFIRKRMICFFCPCTIPLSLLLLNLSPGTSLSSIY